MAKNMKGFGGREPVEGEGVREEFVGPGGLGQRDRNRTVYSDDRSFLLADGRYVFRDYDPVNKRDFFHVITLMDEGNKVIIDMLDQYDRDFENNNRSQGRRASYKQQNYMIKTEDGEDAVDPADIELYRLYQQGDSDPKPKKLPVPSEYAVIYSIVPQLPPKEREVFEYLYDSRLSDAEIKHILDLSDSAWSNRKARFLETMRSIFTGLGYDVPTEEELEEEEEQMEKMVDGIDKQTENELEMLEEIGEVKKERRAENSKRHR